MKDCLNNFQGTHSCYSEVSFSRKRICYFIPIQDPEEHGGYIPAQAVEGSKGYRLMTGGNHEWAMPWIWGKTLEDAESACDKANERLGLNKDEVFEIIASTM